jgi:hypothetical protein
MFNCCALTLAASLLTMTNAYGGSTFEMQNAAAGDHDNLEPDRPDVTNGTHIVDIGLLQMELGVVWNRTAVSQHNAFGGLSVVIGDVLGDHGVHARQREAARRGAARATGSR